MIKVLRGFNKIISLVIILTMIVSISPVFAEGEQLPILKVSSGIVYSGSSTQIKVTLEKIQSLLSLTFNLKYDLNNFDINEADIVVNPELKSLLNLTAAIDRNHRIVVQGSKQANVNIQTPIDVITFKITAKNSAPIKTGYILNFDSKHIIGSKDDQGNYTEIIPELINGTLDVKSKTTTSGGSATTPPTSTPTPKPTATVNPNATPSVVEISLNPVMSGTKATVAISETSASQAIDQAIQKAKTGNTTSEVKFNVNTTGDINTIETTLKQSTVAKLKSSAVNYLTIASTDVTVKFDQKALAAIAENSTGDVVLTIDKADITTLSKDAQDKAGNRPVYNFNLVSNSKTINDFKDGLATITIPYTLKNGELAKDLVVYSVDSLQKVNGTKYDESKKAVVITTSKFDKFGFAFEAPKVKFNDVSGWAEQYVYYLSDKGIINGKADGIFAPDDNITRAEFVAILARSVGISKDQAVNTSFTDVSSTDWYAQNVAWASENKIVLGYEDGSFGPNKTITREEICAIIVRALAANNLAPEKAEFTFSDANVTSEWAKDSIASLAKMGVLSGKGDNLFAPKDFATRAETAKIVTGMYKVLKGIN